MLENCPICQTELIEKRSSGLDNGYDCPQCGKFVMQNHTKALLPSLDEEKTAVISHAIRKRQKKDKTYWPFIDDDSIMEILKNSLPSINEQANNLIIWLAEELSPGEQAWIQPPTHQSIIGAKNPDGFAFIVRHLFDQGILDGNLAEATGARGRAFVNLTFDGWHYYGQLRRGAVDSRKAFMAMEYGDKELDEIVEKHFKPAVADTGFELCRLDKNPKAGLIDDHLRVEIRNSRFLISDLTHENRGAYWEAGFAEGLGKPVIYTCKKEVFEENKTHFDTNHHLTITWDTDNLSEVINDLKATIRATLPDEAKMSDD